MPRRDRLRGTPHLLRESLGALAVATTCSVFTPALAQQAPADEAETQSAASSPSEDVEEIVVRGQAGQGIEADAAVSVTAFGAADLAALGVDDVADLAQFTPNLEIPKFGSTTVSFFIRGVGLNDFTPAASTSVAVYYDDISLNLPQFALSKTFDIEQVDILKGPIGAGAGRNASAGAIKIYSRKPTGDFAAFVRSEYTIGSFNADDTEGAVEFPIVADQLSARLSFRVSHQDPYVSNGCGNAPPVGLGRVKDLSVPGDGDICGEPIAFWANQIADPYVTPILGSPNPQFNNFIVYPSQDAPNTDPEGPQYYSPPGLSDDIEGNRYKISYLPAGLEDLVNDASSWAARGIFRYRPADIDMDWQLIAHGGRVDELAPLGQSIPIGAFINGNGTRGYLPAEIGEQFQDIKDRLVAGGATTEEADAEAPSILANSLARNLDTRPYHGDYDRTGRTSVDSYGTSLRGDWELESGHVTSISSYEFYDVKQTQDFDFMPIVVLENFLEHEAWQFVQSLDWQDELEDEPLRWGIGAYFLMDELDYEQDQVTAPGIAPLFRPYVQKTWSANIGATFSWDFLDDFTLEGGVRYNWERKKMDVNGFTIGDTAVCRPEVGLVTCVQQYTFDAPTGELTLRYHFNEDVSSYVKYTHGWKGAQLNAGTARSLGDEPITAADPETIDAFEIGLHGEWFDGRASLDLSLFHYTYENYQVFIIQNDFGSIPQRVVINANDAVYYGAEANIVVSPVENLNLIGRFGWNESEFLDFTRQQIYAIAQPGDNPPQAISVNLDYTGNQLPNAPTFKISATADYTLELGRYGSLIPRYDLSWTDDVYFDSSEGRGDPNAFGGNVFPEFVVGQPAYLLHAVRLTWRSATGNMEVAGWARNLTDELYKVYAFNAQSVGFVGNFVGQPRTYGVSLLLSW